MTREEKRRRAISVLTDCADAAEGTVFAEYYLLGTDALRAQQEAEKNEPLTLDEFREMEAEPVYIVGNAGDISYQGWEIVEKVICGIVYFRPSNRRLSTENYKKTWLAYRRKPEEKTI